MPPSVNHTYVTTRSGRRVRMPAAERYQDVVGWETIVAKNASGWSWDGGHLRITVKLYPPDRRRRDAHNYLKVLLDGVAEGLGVDDKWFLVHEEPPELDKANPRVVVTVAALPAQEASDD